MKMEFNSPRSRSDVVVDVEARPAGSEQQAYGSREPLQGTITVAHIV